MPANFSTGPSRVDRQLSRLVKFAVRYAVELSLIAIVLYVCFSRGLDFRVDIYDPEQGLPTPDEARTTEEITATVGPTTVEWFIDLARRTLTTIISTREVNVIADLPSNPTGDRDGSTDLFTSVARTNDPAPHISNLTLVLSPDYGERKKLPAHIIAAKKQRVQSYLARYAPSARDEMKRHGIPASITLAQALLESNAGDSKLAVNSNNHFGIKCRTKCLGCTCRNYGDDTRYDMFRVFDSVAESFAEHSRLLNTPRYAKLKKHGKDYRKWAHGLKACGYATDKRYGHKLITIIDNLDLTRYDV
jgi:hypothetical protein